MIVWLEFEPAYLEATVQLVLVWQTGLFNLGTGEKKTC